MGIVATVVELAPSGGACTKGGWHTISFQPLLAGPMLALAGPSFRSPVVPEADPACLLVMVQQHHALAAGKLDCLHVDGGEQVLEHGGGEAHVLLAAKAVHDH